MSAESDDISCNQSVYAGFDSRLATEVVGRLPPDSTSIQGFEIVNARPLVAFRHQLMALARNETASLPSLEPIDGIAVDAAGRVHLQYQSRISTVGTVQVESDANLSRTVTGRLFDSGNPLFAEARTEGNLVRFIARNADGRALPIVTVPGKLRAASWNSVGLAAVVGDDLFAWPGGSKKFLRLASDPGLRSAIDVCMVSQDRVVVALEHVVLLVSPNTRLVLVGFPARCRWDKGVLYLLDGQRGIIWTVRGVDKLGNPEQDTAYATSLIRALPREAQENNLRVLEAARILGCRKTRALMSSAFKAN